MTRSSSTFWISPYAVPCRMGYVRTDDEIQNVLDDRVIYQRDHHGRMRQRPIVTSEERATALTIASGSAIELAAGAIGIVVAIVAIVGFYQLALASIATIVVSFALLAQGSTMAARWQHAIHIAGSERAEAVGISTEVFGGLAGLTLGVLALVDVQPHQLLPAAAIVLGASMLLGGPSQPEISHGHVTRRATRTSGGVMVMA